MRRQADQKPLPSRGARGERSGYEIAGPALMGCGSCKVLCKVGWNGGHGEAVVGDME